MGVTTYMASCGDFYGIQRFQSQVVALLKRIWWLIITFPITTPILWSYPMFRENPTITFLVMPPMINIWYAHNIAPIGPSLTWYYWWLNPDCWWFIQWFHAVSIVYLLILYWLVTIPIAGLLPSPQIEGGVGATAWWCFRPAGEANGLPMLHRPCGYHLAVMGWSNPVQWLPFCHDIPIMRSCLLVKPSILGWNPMKIRSKNPMKSPFPLGEIPLNHHFLMV